VRLGEGIQNPKTDKGGKIQHKMHQIRSHDQINLAFLGESRTVAWYPDIGSGKAENSVMSDNAER
jgi:hypothetical protein